MTGEFRPGQHWSTWTTGTAQMSNALENWFEQIFNNLLDLHYFLFSSGMTASQGLTLHIPMSMGKFIYNY